MDQQKLADFCRLHNIQKLWLFGSVLREDFRPDSDIDVLVEFTPGARLSLGDFVRVQRELGQMLGREVDLVQRKSVESGRNYIRRRNILASLEPLYVAG
ncbi:MAG: nucleotidyltransferase domain-containing protein [Chloroflexi bacterium]|nr:nucleotidyltransferase domain-containing protein [Chloroflexota bacterium]